MNHLYKALISAASAALCCLTAQAQVSFGVPSLLDDGWSFILADVAGGEDPSMDDGTWEKVDLPHDWSVRGVYSPDNASCTGFLPAGIGWYRKHLDGTSLASDKVYIYFEGVYNRSTVYLNGHELGYRPSGYNSFMYELTPYLDRGGDNVIAVRVDHSRIADSRWYPGSGIYRNVWLVQSGDTHFAQWGIGYKAAEVSGSLAKISVDVSIEGPCEGASLRLVIRDADGGTVAKATKKAQSKLSVMLSMKNPRRWDIDDPYMYTLEASIVRGNDLMDKAQVRMGIRTLEFDADRGFALNGRSMKVKGVCLHHDMGVLGAAVPSEVMRTRLETLKTIGVNAVRTSHNPASPAFYDLCDELGLLVMDEAFDEFEFNKKKWVKGWNVGEPAMDGTGDYFEEWCERDVADMVRRDRNHPSVFLWSIGNEVDYPNDPYSHPILDGGNLEFHQRVSGGYRPQAPNAERIGFIARRLAGCVRAVDTSRPVTGALAGVAMSNQTIYPDVIDVVGYNYSESRYAKDHKAYPHRILFGSENNGGLREWKYVRDNDYIFGQFIWTGADYLGESREWPSRGFYSGLIDLANNIKPRGYYRESLWSSEPMCYVGTYMKPAEGSGEGEEDSTDAWDIWNYEPGQLIRVVCYTNAYQARLLLNGEVAGQMTVRNDDNGIIGWDVPYAPGVLTAEGYDSQGNKVSQYSIRSSSVPCALAARDSDITVTAGRVAEISVEIFDADGNIVRLGDNEITCTVEGPGTLLGLEAGNNSDMTSYTDNVQRAFMGRLKAYIKTPAEPCTLTVKFSSPLLRGCQVSVSSHK